MTNFERLEGRPPVGAASPAATVAALRDGAKGLEVLLVRRNPKGSFAGMWVFPGGRVDEEDHRVAAGESSGPPGPHGGGNVGADSEVAAARHAAVREAEEEAGLRLDPDGLAVLSWWLPPAEAARQFATWFFVAAVVPGQAVVVDKAEVHDHVWLPPAEALARRDRGEISLAPPTWMTLHWLAQPPDVASALAAARSRPPDRFVTHVVFSEAGTLAATLWEGDEGYDDGDLYRSGPRRRLVADDGGWHFESSPA